MFDAVAPVRTDVGAIEAYVQGRFAVETNDFGRAADLFGAAVELEPADVRLRLEWAAALAELGRVDETLLQLQVARDLGAPAWETCATESVAWTRSGDSGEALGALADCDGTDAPEAWYRTWFEVALEAGDGEAQLLAGERYVAAYPERAESWRILGIAQRDHGEGESGAASFAQAMSLPGNAPWDGEQFAVLTLLSGDFEASAAAAETCIAAYRDHIPCRVLLAHALSAQEWFGDPPGTATQEAIRQLVGRTGGSRVAVARAARSLRELAHPVVSIAYARELLAQRPYNATVLMQGAWIAVAAERQDVAVELMLRVLELDPASFDALNFVGYAWAEQNIRLDEAEAYIRRALELRPADTSIEDSLAWVLYRQGRLDEALAIQEQVVARTPDNAVLLDHLGDMLEAVGRYPEALQVWERALELADERDEDVLDTVPAKLEELRTRLGQTGT